MEKWLMEVQGPAGMFMRKSCDDWKTKSPVAGSMIDCLTKVTASSLLAYAKHERIGLGNSMSCSKTVIW